MGGCDSPGEERIGLGRTVGPNPLDDGLNRVTGAFTKSGEQRLSSMFGQSSVRPQNPWGVGQAGRQLVRFPSGQEVEEPLRGSFGLGSRLPKECRAERSREAAWSRNAGPTRSLLFFLKRNGGGVFLG